MEHQEIIASIRHQISEIGSKGEAYFRLVIQSFNEEADSYQEAYSTDGNLFFSKLPGEIQAQASSLAHEIVAATGRLAGPARNSPLVTDADQRDLSILTKTLRAAILLRRYTHWDTEILHDEGTVLGVQRAGQSEDRPLLPTTACSIFQDSLQRLLSIIDLAASSGAGNFIPETGGPSVSRIKQNTGFIMMWMDSAQPELDDICDLVKDAFLSFGIRAIRADDIEHEGLITERILNEIASAEFLMADLTGARPSVYYEVGYAHALNRRVILYRKKGTQLHFDLAGYNCPEYENLRELREKLTKRLEQLTNKMAP